MEPVTHFLTGACLGRAGFNRKTAYGTLAMTLAAEAPDIDVVSSFGGPVTGFCHHRGITHTLLGAPFMALAVTGVVWCIAWCMLRLGRKPPPQPVRWGWVWLLALVADGSHLLLDFTNNYGLRPFFPFSPHWYAWSIVFIFEPIMFLLLLGGLVMPALLGLVDGELRGRRRTSEAPRGLGWAMAALIGVVLLYALRNAEHSRAIALVAAQGTVAVDGPRVREPMQRIGAEPVMVNPFVWHTVAETASGYATARVDTLDDSITPSAEGFVRKPPVTATIGTAKRSYLGRVYGSWSTWPIAEDVGAKPPPGDTQELPDGARTVLFRDMRFTPESLSLFGNVPSSEDPPLSGWVVVGPDGTMLSQWMSGRRQP